MKSCSAPSARAASGSPAIRIWLQPRPQTKWSPRAGSGQFSSLDLDKVLARAAADVRADIGDAEEGMRGGSARKDVEKMFQLIYLDFTARRADPVQFEAFKARLRPRLANQSATPEAAFETRGPPL